MCVKAGIMKGLRSNLFCLSVLLSLSLSRDVPSSVRADFVAESSTAKERLSRLKDQVRLTGVELVDG